MPGWVTFQPVKPFDHLVICHTVQIYATPAVPLFHCTQIYNPRTLFPFTIRQDTLNPSGRSCFIQGFKLLSRKRSSANTKEVKQ